MTDEEIIRRLKILWEFYLVLPDVNNQKRVEENETTQIRW